MKKLGAIFRETSQGVIKSRIRDSSTLLVVKYLGLKSPEMSILRQSLKSARAGMLVVKNTVARRALKDTGLEVIIKSIEGPCGLVFAQEEPVDLSRVLYKFSQEHAALKVEGGIFHDRLVDKDKIEALAKLPGKQILRTQVVGGLKSPITRIVLVLNGNLRKLVICLEQIRQKRGN
jgi:large subunit ribosomal protein L10